MTIKKDLSIEINFQNEGKKESIHFNLGISSNRIAKAEINIDGMGINKKAGRTR